MPRVRLRKSSICCAYTCYDDMIAQQQCYHRICCQCQQVKRISQFWGTTTKCKRCFPSQGRHIDRTIKSCDYCGCQKSRDQFEKWKYKCKYCRSGRNSEQLCIMCRQHLAIEADKFCSKCWQWLKYHPDVECKWCRLKKNRFDEFKNYSIGDDCVCIECTIDGKHARHKVQPCKSSADEFDICCLLNAHKDTCPDCQRPNTIALRTKPHMETGVCVICSMPLESHGDSSLLPLCGACGDMESEKTKICQQCKVYRRSTDFVQKHEDNECIGCKYLHIHPQHPAYPCDWCGFWVDIESTDPANCYQCLSCTGDKDRIQGYHKCQVCNRWFPNVVDNHGYVCAECL